MAKTELYYILALPYISEVRWAEQAVDTAEPAAKKIKTVSRIYISSGHNIVGTFLVSIFHTKGYYLYWRRKKTEEAVDAVVQYLGLFFS